MSEKIYLDPVTMIDWQKQCLQEAQKIKSSENSKLISLRLNDLFSRLKVSHLSVYSPSESQKIWDDVWKSTGLRSRFIDGELVVTSVIPGSSADEKKIKMGDIIEKIEGESPSVSLSESTAGIFEVRRHEKRFSVELTLSELKIDNRMSFTFLDSRAAVLRVPSFRSEFFSEAEIFRIKNQIHKFQDLIIDFRDNPGGNFAAGLQFLSLFICRPTVVGSLINPKAPKKNKINLSMDMSDEVQIQKISEYQTVDLETFPNSTCFSGQVSVLVGELTASTAEIVSLALKENIQARIYGTTSAGQCLVGIWYPWPALGRGYFLNIPVAYYRSAFGQKIEGDGLSAEVVYEKIQDYQQGHDSLVRQVWQKSRNKTAETTLNSEKNGE